VVPRFAADGDGYALRGVESQHLSFPQLSHDLEALKVALVGMTPDDIPPIDAAAVAREISAIRLQLKRLEADRAAAMDRYDSARDSGSPELKD
jgi:hypothetical protein